jgi:HlyD family secretion protein
VNGVVNAISLVPADNNYQVEIGLPDGLVTNYNKTLPVTHEMKASAEIVTEDLRLIERFFMPVRKVLKEGFLTQLSGFSFQGVSI